MIVHNAMALGCCINYTIYARCNQASNLSIQLYIMESTI